MISFVLGAECLSKLHISGYVSFATLDRAYIPCVQTGFSRYLKDLSFVAHPDVHELNEIVLGLCPLKALERLKLEDCKPSKMSGSMKAFLESEVVRNLRSLKLIGFNRCQVGKVNWTDMRQLEELVLDGPRISAAFAESVITAPNLMLLNLGLGSVDMGDVAIETIAESCTQLRSIRMAGVSHFGFSRFAANCTLVEEIRADSCKGVGDLTLVTLGKECAHLHNLNIRFCQGISDQGLVGLCEQPGKLSRLKVVDVRQCKGLTDRALVALSNCPLLEYLNIEGLYKVTDNGVLALALKCRKLKLLDISWCCEVTLLSLEELVKECFPLTCIVHNGCGQLSHSDINHLAIMMRRKLEHGPKEESPQTSEAPTPREPKLKKKKKKKKNVDFDALLKGDLTSAEVKAKPRDKGKVKKKAKGKPRRPPPKEENPLSKWKS